MSRKCEQFHKSITDYIDRSLPADKISEFEKHLNDCVSCRKELDKQKKWLAESFVNQEDVVLAPEDQKRLQEKIMAAIRSNEQSHRAAAYINDYKNKAEFGESIQNGPSEAIQAEIIRGRSRGKDFKFLRSLPVLAGYAAVLILVSVTVLLIKDIQSPGNRDSLTGQDERVMMNDAGMMTEAAAGTMEMEGYSADSATKPMIKSDLMSNETVNETGSMSNSVIASAENTENDGNSIIEKWKSFSGRLGELPLDPDMFSDSEAFEAQGVFYSSKALRILTTQASEIKQSATEANSEPLEETNIIITADNTTAQTSDSNRPQDTVGKVLLLTAWDSWNIVDAADNLKFQLQENEANYDIIILDDSTDIAKIEGMIGPDEVKAWREQIKSQKLEDLVWLALIAK